MAVLIETQIAIPGTYSVKQIEADAEKLNSKARIHVSNMVSQMKESKSRLEKDVAQLRSSTTEYLNRGSRERLQTLGLKLSKFENWSGPGPIPVIETVVHKIEWEHWIKNERRFEIGCVDMCVTISVAERLELYPPISYASEEEPPYFDLHKKQLRLFFEAKPHIKSLGELFRQINLYRCHADGLWFVVCPDPSNAERIRSQGIGFIHCPAIAKASQQGTLL